MEFLLAKLPQLTLTPWKLVGYLGAFIFASRWFVQFYVSRKAGKPIMSRWFWILSLMGSVMVLS